MHPTIHHLSTYLLVLFALAGSSISYAQNILGFNGGGAFGTLAGARAALSGTPAMFGNASGMANLEKLSWVAAAEMPQGNPDLKYLTGAFVLPTNSGTFGLAAELHGFDLYREQALSIGYARKLLENLNAGLRTSWHQLVIADHGSRSHFSGDVGLQSAIGEEWVLGFSAHLPFQSRLVDNELLPSIVRLGLCYKPSDHIFLVADLTKQSNLSESLAVALEYAFADSFAVRLGVGSSPARFAFGISYRSKSNLRIDTGTLVHQNLGISPLFSIGND